MIADRKHPNFSNNRKWTYSFQVLVAVTSLVAVMAMLNYLSERHHARINLSKWSSKQLSAQTQRVLHSITNEIRVTVFFDRDAESELYELSTSLLREYTQANPLIKVKAVDPTRHPTDAELVLARYKITGLKDKNFIIFDCEDRTRIIYQSELSDYDINAVIAGQSKEFKRKTYNGELLFTTAIFNLANPRDIKVCFLSGHGEHAPDRSQHPHGYAKFAAILHEKTNARWEKLPSLIGTNDIPADCQLLVIAGPRTPFEDVELEKINRYLTQGGRLFALIANMAYSGNSQSGLEKLLAKWGVGVANNIIFDPQYSPTGSDLLTARVNNEHPVMKALLSDNNDLRIRLILPRAVGQSTLFATNSATTPDSPKITVLAATSENGEEAAEIRDGVPYRNAYTDRKGLFPLIVAAEQGNVRNINADRGLMRMIVVGDSLCLDNELIDNAPANHLFAGLAVDWLLDRPQVLLEGLLPQPIKEYQILVTKTESFKIRLIFLVGIPGIVLLIGGLVWWKRRR